MICPACGTLNIGGDPHDHGCRVCGVDATDEEYLADSDEASDNRRRDLELREGQSEHERHPSRS